MLSITLIKKINGLLFTEQKTYLFDCFLNVIYFNIF